MISQLRSGCFLGEVLAFSWRSPDRFYENSTIRSGRSDEVCVRGPNQHNGKNPGDPVIGPVCVSFQAQKL